MRPGFTGYAQVHGRNAISWEEKFDLDVEYVDHVTFVGDWKIILQIPMSVLIGRIVDFFNDYVLTFQAKGLADGLLLLCYAIPLTALGTTLVVQTDLVPAAPDGMVRAFGDAMGWDFGRAKYTFDIVIIILSAAYALVRTGHTVGIGVGTVAAALFTGRLCQLFGRLLAPWFRSYLTKCE